MIGLRGGAFAMGSEDPDAFSADGEGPVREVAVGAFAIGAYAVTNGEFATFVESTGHVTDAERFGWSFVFHLLVGDRVEVVGASGDAPWWLGVAGATWRTPEGPGSSVGSRETHPVVHVSWNDAAAYCDWAGGRLPTEAEWEYAARGGLEGKRFPWGDELAPGGRWRCNIWQGRFPDDNTADDGHVGTAPVDAFEPNGFGLYNASGNVWEWCADRFSPGARAIRGGSYLCHDSYCNRYRVAARSGNTPESTTGHTGFRCAANLP